MGFNKSIVKLVDRMDYSTYETDSSVLGALVETLETRGNGSYFTVPELVEILNEEFNALGA